MNRLKKTWLTSTKALRSLWGRLRLRNRSVTVISNDCWGGFMHRSYRLPFNTPFIGMFIVGPDYIEMLEHPKVLRLPLRFIRPEESRHVEYLRSVGQMSHPVGVLGDTGPEVHFLHHPDEPTARRKWERRVGRIDWNNAIVKFSDRDIFDEELLRRFDALPYPVKVCFTPRPWPGYASACYLPEFRRQEHVSLCWRVSNLHWSFVKAANSLPGATKKG